MRNTLRNIHENLLNTVSDFLLAFEVLTSRGVRNGGEEKLKQKKLLGKVFWFQNTELKKL